VEKCGVRDLPHSASRSLVKFVFREEDEHEESLYGTANHRVSEGSRGRHASQGTVQKHGFSDASFYTWRAKFGGMEVSEARRLKDLEVENARLKKQLAEAMLDMEALKVVVKGKP
jgi:putative transposase